MLLELIVAGFTASLLTLFDLDRTFYIPAKINQKVILYLWYWGFIVANGLLAAGLYSILADQPFLQQTNPIIGAIEVGIGYLAIVRVKFASLDIGGKEVPLGFELAYEGAKGFAYKRINNIAKSARYEETNALAAKEDLATLAARANLSINQDSLLPAEDKSKLKQWLLGVLQDTASTDQEKRLALASFILSGQTSAV